ncbi:MAG: glycosyltransferase family 39 protein [Ktedonobacterales bacterium]
MSRTLEERQQRAPAQSPLRWIAGLSVPARVMILVTLGALALRILPLNGGPTDYDEGVYWQSLRAMAHGLPLFSSVFSSQPPFFLLGLYPFYLLFGQTLFAARLAVTLYSLLGVIALYFAGRALGRRWAGALAAALLAVDPLYLTESHTLQAEAPALALMAVAVALAMEAMRQTVRARHWLAVASGVALGLGFMGKLLDIVALVPIALYLAAPIFALCLDEQGAIQRPDATRLRPAIRSVVVEYACCFGAFLLVCALVIAPFVGSIGALYDQVVRFHLVAGNADNLGLTHNISVILKARALYLPGVLAIMALGLALWRRAWWMAPLALWLLAALILLARQQPLLNHHLTLLAPMLALIGALALPLAVTAAHTSPRTAMHGARVTPHAPHTQMAQFLPGSVVALALIVVLVGAVSGVVANRTAAAAPSSETQRMASALQAFSQPGELVVSDDQSIAGLADRDVPPQLVDTSQVRISSGYLTASQLEAIITQDHAQAILFASGRFDLIPGFRAWVAAHSQIAATFSHGHALYLLTSLPPTTA